MPLTDAYTEDDAQTDAVIVLREAYGAFAATVETVTDESSWRATECTGWSVRDLIFHCLGDAQRGLVALHTPSSAPVDRNAFTYWADWVPAASSRGRADYAAGRATADAASGRRYVRVMASMFLNVEQLLELYLETAAAVVNAAVAADLSRPVATQGHTLITGDLIRTLVVEATIHHLDMESAALEGRPSAAGLAETRRTLDGLLGHRVPVTAWDEADYARKATGRRLLTEVERAQLGADADRFPLFG